MERNETDERKTRLASRSGVNVGTHRRKPGYLYFYSMKARQNVEPTVGLIHQGAYIEIWLNTHGNRDT